MFIGQTRLLAEINQMIEYEYPRFTIIYGSKHGGKKLLAEYIALHLKTRLVYCGIKVEEVRSVIELCYQQTEPTLYLFADTDKMSPAAKNALLKITEEPPQKAYFILTAIDSSNVLATLRSRGYLMALDPYSPQDLTEYAQFKNYGMSEKELKMALDICNCPGDMDIIREYNISDFYSFVESVIDDIAAVNQANAFKIGSWLKLKETDTGWDVQLFMRAVMRVCANRMFLTPLTHYAQSIVVTSKYLSQLNINGINKAATIDMWILDLRSLWLLERGAK